MTLLSKLCYRPKKKRNLLAPLGLKTEEISIVIPVKDNQNGIDFFLSEFFKTHSKYNYPKEIIIVDNNSIENIEIYDEFPVPVKIFKCLKNGPASARNLGLNKALGDWILFTDSDCVPSSTFLAGYVNSLNGSIGYAGNVKALGSDTLSEYYESQEILIPLKVYENKSYPRPEYLITANALVWKEALEIVGGFDENIKIAAGEDIDLGFRLLEIGNLSYAFDSIVYHNFNGGIISFVNRFIRYGTGNKMLSELYSLDLKPRLFMPNKSLMINYFLAYLQYICLTIGYKHSR